MYLIYTLPTYILKIYIHITAKTQKLGNTIPLFLTCFAYVLQLHTINKYANIYMFKSNLQKQAIKSCNFTFEFCLFLIFHHSNANLNSKILNGFSFSLSFIQSSNGAQSILGLTKRIAVPRFIKHQMDDSIKFFTFKFFLHRFSLHILIDIVNNPFIHS